MTTIAPDTADLAQRARKAHAAAQLTTQRREAQRRLEILGEIHKALSKLGITPAAGEPFVNAASGQICVPLIVGEVQVETDEDEYSYPVQTHAVAAEWDPEDRSVRLVADVDYDDYDYNPNGRWLYPAGCLHTLADVGEAMERGGQRPAPATRGLTSEYLNEHDNAILTAAEAVCAALADIADAIQASRGL